MRAAPPSGDSAKVGDRNESTAGELQGAGDVLDLEPLARWCGQVLERALDSGGPAPAFPPVVPPASDLPPLPPHLREPLNHHGFDAFDQTVVALALAPDLDPPLAAAIGSLT